MGLCIIRICIILADEIDWIDFVANSVVVVMTFFILFRLVLVVIYIYFSFLQTLAFFLFFENY